VEICAPVTATAFAWLPPTPTVGEGVTFTASATGTEPIAFSWDFGDGSGGGGLTVTHTYSTAGDYMVTLTATNECSEQVVTHTVAVGEAPPVCEPVVEVTCAGPPSLLVDEEGVYTATAAPITATLPITYTWDNDTVGPTAVYSWTAAGTYTLTVTATNACGQAVTSVLIQVSAPPEPTYEIFLPIIVRDFGP
jgi:PKD repeat protein